jgi:hypothetical protein
MDGWIDGEVSEREERLRYLSDLVSEMEALAAREGCEALAYMLAMCRLEALRQAGDALQASNGR